VLGLTFKPNTDDMREAPSLSIIQALQDSGVKIRAHDPEGMEHARGLLPGVELVEGPYEAVEGADALAIVTEWKEFRSPDFDNLKKQLKTPVIFDGRNLYDPGMMKKQGFMYYAIGRGEGVTR
jgi:UDPglucose 6-dehydrogenase